MRAIKFRDAVYLPGSPGRDMILSADTRDCEITETSSMVILTRKGESVHVPWSNVICLRLQASALAGDPQEPARVADMPPPVLASQPKPARRR